MPTNHSITLYFNDGRSDKIYTAGIYPRDAGFVVNFAFGRRGSTLQSGSKTPMPVDHQTAVKIYEKLVSEKLAKGYTPGQDGTPYQGTERESVATGVLPQLLNPIDQEQAEQLIRDDDWWMQEKFDGKRILIQKRDGQIIGIIRRGSLYQPVCLGVRDDVGVEACTVGQLKYKGTSEDDEDTGEAEGARP